jgi:hypothetical protein
MKPSEKFLAEHYPNPNYTVSTRREFLAKTGAGLGLLSLASLLKPGTLMGSTPSGVSVPLHFPAKAKHVIHIFLNGAPSQVDTFDPKPKLAELDGKTLPGDDTVGFGSPFAFKKCGESGHEISEVFPHLQKLADELCIIKSMHTDIPAHETATVFMNTGNLRLPRPSLGSWVLYGLGSMNDNLPGYISLRDGGLPGGGTSNWASVFLPGKYQATSINASSNDPSKLIDNLRNTYLTLPEQRRQLDLVSKLNNMHKDKLQNESQLEAELASMEMAFRMQTEAAETFDIRGESSSTLSLYGIDEVPAPGAGERKPNKGNNRSAAANARKMLLARRLVEKGVRFVQVWCGGWDTHSDIAKRIPQQAESVDQPIAALLRDLKDRGLLESTLVVINGEFGRTPGRDRNGRGETAGRDHNNKAFFTLLAGGGVKPGFSYGQSDDIGLRAAEDKVHIHDLHATVLRLLGYDHTKLTYRYNGRDFRLTDVAGNIVNPVIA